MAQLLKLCAKNLQMISSKPTHISRWITDHYHLSLNLDVGISERCLSFHFVSLPLEVARPIYPTMCTNLAVQSLSAAFNCVKDIYLMISSFIFNKNISMHEE